MHRLRELGKYSLVGCYLAVVYAIWVSGYVTLVNLPSNSWLGWVSAVLSLPLCATTLILYLDGALGAKTVWQEKAMLGGTIACFMAPVPIAILGRLYQPLFGQRLLPVKLFLFFLLLAVLVSVVGAVVDWLLAKFSSSTVKSSAAKKGDC